MRVPIEYLGFEEPGWEGVEMAKLFQFGKAVYFSFPKYYRTQLACALIFLSCSRSAARSHGPTPRR